MSEAAASTHKSDIVGRTIEFEGRRLYAEVSGSGQPVVFEAGAGEWSAHWSLVTAALGDRFRCIAYDRAGLGRSEPVSGIRSAAVLADEQLRVLDALGVDEPAIVVAHSFGASIARLVADRAPERVAGIVFVDGWHEKFGEWERDNPAPRSSIPMRFLEVLDRAGALRMVNRLLIRVSPPKSPWPLPSETWASMLTISNSVKFHRATADEASAYDEGDRDVAAVTRLDVPLVSLIASEMLSPEQVPAGYPVEQHNAAWQAASARLSELSSSSVVKHVSDTDHMIQLSRPQVVVDAVLEVEGMIRAGAGSSPEPIG